MRRHSPIPEKPMAKAARSSQRAAKKALQRQETLGETPVLAGALEQGAISAEHADAAGGALRNAEGSKRKQLAKRIDELAGKAAPERPPRSSGGSVREERRRARRATEARRGSPASSGRSGSTIGSTQRRG